MDMTPPGVLIPPSKEGLEKRILDAKYEMFLETVEIQKRWRKKMDDIVQGQ